MSLAMDARARALLKAASNRPTTCLRSARQECKEGMEIEEEEEGGEGAMLACSARRNTRAESQEDKESKDIEERGQEEGEESVAEGCNLPAKRT